MTVSLKAVTLAVRKFDRQRCPRLRMCLSEYLALKPLIKDPGTPSSVRRKYTLMKINMPIKTTGEKPNVKILRKKALYRIAPDYAMLFFDHLYSEYLALKPFITEPGTIELLEGLGVPPKRCLLGHSGRYYHFSRIGPTWLRWNPTQGCIQ